ncbi:MAG: DUF2284 domain-containing protein [Candidatus Freyarchaeota archaeon]|nr:DUF2284 domain-containing protein [Candidatus Freyrarchaeum guaymaensis]
MNKLKKDLDELSKLAFSLGASRVKVVTTDVITVDARVQLKCRYPPCPFYGRNKMCPPFTPSAEEFEKYLSKYRYAILVQVDIPLTEDIKARLRDDVKLEDIISDEEFNRLLRARGGFAWKLLNRVVSGVEREAFKMGYRFAVGFAAGACPLCEECDVNSPCKHPFEARPSMEAVGIDVHKTLENAGLSLKWSTRNIITLTGLVLID